MTAIFFFLNSVCLGSLRTQMYFRLSFLSAEEKRQPEIRLRSQAIRDL